MIKKLIKTIVVLIVLFFITLLSYNYYYYYKSLRLNKDVYYELKTVVNNLEKSLELLNNNDISGFLNNNYLMIKHSNYLKNKNHKVYNNIFVRINMLDGSFFSNDVSEALLWFNEFNIKLNIFYSLNNELFNSDILLKNPEKAMNNVKDIKSIVLEINTLLNIKNEKVLAMADDQKIDQEYFIGLEKKIQNSYKFYEVLDYFMGVKKKTNTLVLIQNNRNINQSGGKWIYYMTLACHNYECEMSDIDFVSSLTQAMVDKLIPPEEIRTKKTIWVYEDLGWFFDFNNSAKLALKYFPTKTSFDGVIVVNISIFEELMKNMRPIDFMVEDKQSVINQNEVVDFLINLTQYKNNKDLTINTEKLSSFWTDFSKVFNASYTNLNNFQYLVSSLYDYMDTKKLQMYADKSIIQALKDLGYNNSLQNHEGVDYLAIAKSNILDKSIDHNIKFKVNLKVNIDKDYATKNIVNIDISNDNNEKISDQVYSYFQLWLNKGSNLEKTSFPSKVGSATSGSVDYVKHGFVTDELVDTINLKTAYLASDDVRVYDKDNFLILGGWVVSKSKQNKKIEINYSSDYKIDKEERIYRLFVQKQPNVDYLLNIELSYPSDNNGENTITKNININKDKLIEIKLD